MIQLSYEEMFTLLKGRNFVWLGDFELKALQGLEQLV